MQQLPPALVPLAALKQFVIYRMAPSPTRPGKTDKFAVHPEGLYKVNHGDPSIWLDAQTACDKATALGDSYGVGFSIQRGNNLFFVDLDGHRAADGTWSPLSHDLVKLFPGAYLEISRSGSGLHILGIGTAPEHGCVNKALGLEFYTEGRFCALTGTAATGNIATDHTAALHHITAHLFPFTGGDVNDDGDLTLTSEPDPRWNGPKEDKDLLRRALESRSAAAAFGAGASFKDLWERNVDVLARAFPPDAGSQTMYNESSADAALVAHLAFWTGRHGERVMALMRHPDCMLKREKWNRGDGEEYLRRTICKIFSKSPDGDVLQDLPPEAPTAIPLPPSDAAEQREVEGSVFMSGPGQKDMFRGCVYVTDAHRVLVPGGALLKPDQFNVAFGGYVFSMDDVNKSTTRKAWEAFTESQILRCPQVDTVCFKPDRPPGELIKTQGRTAVNIWWPAEVDRKVGDASPFLNHLRKVLPDERDREILLSYMSACVQHKGKKFPWMPVLQGVQGNGKTLFSLCVAQAVGTRYAFWPKVKSLESTFNKWLGQTLFVGIEELYSLEHQDQVLSNLFTMITGDMGIQIEGKGTDAISAEICCNLMATTNHRDAVRKTLEARRFAMFYTPHQTRADIIRDGMGGDYFPKLYNWLKKEGGFAIVSELLHTRPIEPEFNPAGDMHRAPDTSTTNLAIVETRGGIEQQIIEAVDQGSTGFMGGWVSSFFLDQLLVSLRQNRITLERRKRLMADLGYIPHPGLINGRVNNPVLPDGKKSILFVHRDSEAARITGGGEIARAYTAAQMTSPILSDER